MVWRYRSLSSLAASSIRHLERIVEKVKKGFVSIGRSPPRVLEYVMVKIIRFSDRVEYGIVCLIKRVVDKLSIIQRSLAKSVMLASLWIGLLFTLSLLAIAIILSWR